MTLSAAQIKVAILDHLHNSLDKSFANFDTGSEVCAFELGIRCAVIALIGWAEACKVMPDIYDYIDRKADEHPEISNA